MIDTGLQVGIDATPAQAGAASFKASVMSMASNAERSFDQIKKSISNITGSVFNLRNAFLGLGISGFVQSIMNAAMQMDRIRLTLEASSDSLQQARGDYAIVRDIVNKLALDLPTAAQQFAQMAAAAKGTSMEGAETEHIFRGIATAMTALNATSTHTEYAFYAIQQMISKGVITMEELRRQLGDNLPGAAQLAAQAMGVTTAELFKMIKSGQVLASEFLPKFADVLIERYGSTAEKAAQLTRGMINRIKTALFDLKNFIAQTGFRTEFDTALRGLLKVLQSDELRSALKDLGEDLGKALKLAAEGMQFLALHATTVLHLFEAFIALKFSMWLIDVAREVRNLTKALMEMQLVQTAITMLSGLGTRGPKINPVKYAGTEATPGYLRIMGAENESGFNMFAKSGKLLNSSQFTTRLNSFGGDKELAKKEYEALNLLLDKNGKLLQQNTLDARLNSKAWSEASFGARSMAREMATQVGLMITFNALISKGTPLLIGFTQWLWNAGKAVLTGGLTGIAGLFTDIAAAAGTAWTAITAGALSIGAVLGIVTGGILLAVGALYLFRDTTLTFGSHSAKLKYWLQVPWDDFKYAIGTAWDKLKEVGKNMVDYVKEQTEFIKNFWSSITPDFLSKAWKSFSDWLSTTWVGKVKEAIKTAFDNWGARAQQAQSEDENKAFLEKLHRVFTPEQLKRYSMDFWKGVLGGMSESEMIAYRDEAMAAFQRGHQPPPGKDTPLPPKSQIDRPADTIRKIAEEIKATSELIDLNEKYALDETKLGIAISETTARREAEEKIIQLHLKSGDKRAEIIRQEYMALELLKERLKSVQELRKAAFDDITDIQRTMLMTQAIRQNENAVADLNAQLKAEDAVRKAGAGLRADERKWLYDITVQMEKLHRVQQLITEGKQLEESLNPLKALETEMMHLNTLLDAGAIDWDTYSKAVYDATQKSEESRIEDLKKHGDWKDGIIAGLDEIDLQFHRTAQRSYEAFSHVWSALSDDLTNALDKGTLSLKNFAQTVIHEINKSIVDSLLDGFSKRFKAALNTMTGDLNSGQGIWQGLKDSAGAIFKGKGVVSKNPSQQVVDMMGTAIPKFTNEMTAAMKKTVTDLETGLTQLMQHAQQQNDATIQSFQQSFIGLTDTNKAQWGSAVQQIQSAFFQMIRNVGAEFASVLNSKGGGVALPTVGGFGGGYQAVTGAIPISNFGPGVNRTMTDETAPTISAIFKNAGTDLMDTANQLNKGNLDVITNTKRDWSQVVSHVDAGFSGVFLKLGQFVSQFAASFGASHGSVWGTLLGAVAGAAMAGIGAYHGGGNGATNGGFDGTTVTSGFPGFTVAQGGVIRFNHGGIMARGMSIGDVLKGGVAKDPKLALFGERSDKIPEAFIPMMDRKSIKVVRDSLGNHYAPTPGGMRIPVTLSRYADGGMFMPDPATPSMAPPSAPVDRSMGSSYRDRPIVFNQTVKTPDANSFRKSRNQIQQDLIMTMKQGQKRK